MRLRTQIAVQTVCLIGVGLIAYLDLSSSSRALEERQSQVDGNARDLELMHSLDGVMNWYLTTGDLITSASGTTYLLHPSRQTSQLLSDSLKMLAGGKLARPEVDHEFKSLLRQIEVIDGLLARVAEAPDAEARSKIELETSNLFYAESLRLVNGLSDLSEKFEVRANEDRAQLQVAADGNKATIRRSALLLLFASLGAWLYLTLVVSRPIRRLTERTRSRNLDSLGGSDGHAFHELLVLRATFRKLIEELDSERSSLEEKVLDRTVDLQDALEARSSFLANTSHELRTPLNAILGFTRIIADGVDDDEERQRYLNLMLNSGQHLLSLIDDVLDFSKIDADEMGINPRPTDARETLARIHGMFEQAARAAGNTLVVECGVDVPGWILTDEKRFRQIIVNLIGNALKYTEKGLVEVEASWSSDMLTVSVSDEGIGISEELLPKIFDAFRQEDESHSRAFGGTGLGLAISKRLAELLGGTITVSSKKGRGSVFTLEVRAPRTLAEPRSDEVDKAIPSGDEDTILEGARVLLVDDVSSNRVLGRFMLQRMGVICVEATNGREAVEAVMESRMAGEPFDGVLMDLQMPVLDGYEATRELRAGGYDGFVLALSAAVLPQQRQEAFECGCNGFIGKPFSMEELRTKLSEHIKGHAA